MFLFMTLNDLKASEQGMQVYTRCVREKDPQSSLSPFTMAIPSFMF